MSLSQIALHCFPVRHFKSPQISDGSLKSSQLHIEAENQLSLLHVNSLSGKDTSYLLKWSICPTFHSRTLTNNQKATFPDHLVLRQTLSFYLYKTHRSSSPRVSPENCVKKFLLQAAKLTG